MDTKANGSPDLGQGKRSKLSESHEFRSSESTGMEVISEDSCLLQTWANKMAMLPFDITSSILTASWSTQNGNGISACYPNHLFLLNLVLGFYSSIAGIVLWPFFPKAARAFFIIAFLGILLALTIFFASTLPSNLRDVPWVCLTFIVLIVSECLSIKSVV